MFYFYKYIRENQPNQKSTLTGEHLHLSEDAGRGTWPNWSTIHKLIYPKQTLKPALLSGPHCLPPSPLPSSRWECMLLCVHICLGSQCNSGFVGRFFECSPLCLLCIYTSERGRPVVMNLHWGNVFRFLGLKFDQLLRVICAKAGCFWCQIIFTFYWSVSCVEGWMQSRSYVLKKADSSAVDVSKLLIMAASEEAGRD